MIYLMMGLFRVAVEHAGTTRMTHGFVGKRFQALIMIFFFFFNRDFLYFLFLCGSLCCSIRFQLTQLSAFFGQYLHVLSSCICSLCFFS